MTMTEMMKDAAGLGRGGRMSRQRKREAVLRLLRGEDLDTVSRSLGVTAATLSGWRDAFLAAGEASLATRPATGEALESERLKARLGEMLLERELLEAKIDPPSRWWTPLLSSCGSWKVLDDEDETRFYPRVQTRGCRTFGEQRSTSYADRNRAGDFSLHAAQLADGCEWWSTAIQG